MARCFPWFVGLAVAAAMLAGADHGGLMTIYDFARGDDPWPSINDGVMGGVSSGAMIAEPGFASFRGDVSFDNNGGFASVRSRPDVRDLSDFDGIVVRVRGDGHRYGLRLRTSEAFDGVSYQAVIEPPAGEWADIAVPFSDFRPVFRGRTVPDHPPLDTSRVTTFGLIIARQEGPFRLDIDSIHAYSDSDDANGDA
jgi:monofunctional biosynthetic peptidoglycan transglycosylase